MKRSLTSLCVCVCLKKSLVPQEVPAWREPAVAPRRRPVCCAPPFPPPPPPPHPPSLHPCCQPSGKNMAIHHSERTRCVWPLSEVLTPPAERMWAFWWRSWHSVQRGKRSPRPRRVDPPPPPCHIPPSLFRMSGSCQSLAIFSCTWAPCREACRLKPHHAGSLRKKAFEESPNFMKIWNKIWEL